jgi:putative N-acetylmannosamine-6-phosphate epimerase
LAESPAFGAVPLGVVPFEVADGIVKMARRNESGQAAGVRYSNCIDIRATQSKKNFRWE